MKLTLNSYPKSMRKKHHSQIDDLLKVLEISSLLALNQDLQVLLKQIEQAAAKVMNCERSTVFAYDQCSDKLFTIVEERPEKLSFPADYGIAGSCFKNGILIHVEDAYQDPRFNQSIDKLTGFKTRNVLAAPMLSTNHNSLGVLEVMNKKGGSFNEWDKFLLEVLSGQCGVAIHRHSLIQEFAENKRLQKELAIAQSIQQSLLPISAPVIAGYDIAGWSQSAEATSGDFFDFHLLDDGRLILFLADVSGHGIGPALLAAECWALQQAVFSWAENYDSSLTWINRLICHHIPCDRFITAFTGILHAECNTFKFLSAGHGPVFILRESQSRFETLSVTGIPLGIMADTHYEFWQTVTFNPGDILIAFTDGLFEWENASGSRFGIERICEIVLHHANRSSDEILKSVYLGLLGFAEGTQQQDDLTAVVIKKLPND